MRAWGLLLLTSCGAGADLREAEHEKERIALREQLGAADARNEAAAAKIRELHDRINVLDTENSGKAVRINDLQRELDRFNTILSKMEADFQVFGRQLEVQLAHLTAAREENQRLRQQVTRLEGEKEALQKKEKDK